MRSKNQHSNHKTVWASPGREFIWPREDGRELQINKVFLKLKDNGTSFSDLFMLKAKLSKLRPFHDDYVTHALSLLYSWPIPMSLYTYTVEHGASMANITFMNRIDQSKIGIGRPCLLTFLDPTKIYGFHASSRKNLQTKTWS